MSQFPNNNQQPVNNQLPPQGYVQAQTPHTNQYPGAQYPGAQYPGAQYNQQPPIFQTVPPERMRPAVGWRQALSNCKKYLWHFSGRASRSEFWWVYLTWSTIPVVAIFVFYAVWMAVFMSAFSTETPDDTFIIVFLIASVVGLIVIFALLIASVICTMSVGFRRLQDAGFPGALWCLTYAGLGIVPLVMCWLESNPKGLQYDKPEDINRP